MHANPDLRLQKQIRDLEKMASRVLEMKRQSRPKRPIIIEFCGSPKSGKTQAVTSLTIFLKRNGFKVRVLTERASVSPVSDKRSPFFNVWTGASILAALIPYLSESVPDVDVVIADRGIFDTLCWFTWLVDEGSMTASESSELTSLFLTKRFRQSTDLVLAFTASAEASMEREYANLLTRKLGSIMAPRVLESYVESIRKAVERYGEEFKSVVPIDTTHNSQNDVAVRVTRQVLESIEHELEERVAGLERFRLEEIRGQGGFIDVDHLGNISGVKFVPRKEIEADDDLVQIVPVAVLADSNLKQVMAFKKRRETLGSKSSPERDRNLLYVGGHARAEDAFGIQSGAVRDLARSALERELSEELGTTIGLTPEVFCYWDTEGTDSSRRHLAVVHVAKVNFEELRLRLDGYELVQPHNSEVSGKVIPIATVAEWPSSHLESWSRAILQHVFNVSLHEESTLLDIVSEPSPPTPGPNPA